MIFFFTLRPARTHLFHVAAVWFIPDNDTSVSDYLGIAQETAPACQSRGFGCRGNFFIPPSMNGTCPTVTGDDLTCVGQPINNTQCLTSVDLENVVLPWAGGQTSCVRMATHVLMGW